LGVVAAIIVILKKYLDTVEGRRNADLIRIKMPLIGSV
jgi:hypothetical protein